MDAAPDDRLMLAYAAGDIAAFETLYQRYRLRLHRFLLRLVKNPATADELYQECWARVVSARERFRAEERFTSWLFAIAYRIAMDHLRRHQPEPTADGEIIELPTSQEADPAWRLQQAEQIQRLLDLLAELPAEQRAVVMLRAEGELTLEEAAAAAGTGRETIKSRLRYAMARLRKGLST